MQSEIDAGVADAIVEAVQNALSSGDEVEFGELGVFRVALRSARVERMPDGSHQLTPPARQVVFQQA